MNAERIGKLTERQRECLRLVLKHYTSKEMARELGIGVDAVDQRLKSAMRKLGASSRLEAARMLAACEGRGFTADPPEQNVAPRLSTAGVEPDAASSARSTFRLRKKLSLGFLRRLLPRTMRATFVLCACLAGVAFGVVQMGLPLDLWLWDSTVAAYRRPASGMITSVIIDERSIEALGPVPWPSRHYTLLFKRLDEMGAAKIVSWPVLDRPMDPDDDRALAGQLQSMGGRVNFVVDTVGDPVTGTLRLPLPEFRARASLSHGAFIAILSTTRRIPHNLKIGDRFYPSAASELTGVYFNHRKSWAGILAGIRFASSPIDYSIDARTIPTVSAIDVMNGEAPPAMIAGKAISLARVGPSPYTDVAPGVGPVSADRTFGVAAETLIQGVPQEVPWTFTFLPAVLLVVGCARFRNAIVSASLIGGGIAGLLLLPTMLLPHSIYIEITPALFLFLLVGVVFSWKFVQKAHRSRRGMKVATKSA